MRSFIKAIPAIRPPFLILAPICVNVGLATAHYEGHAFSAWFAILALVGAIFAAMWVNTLNELQDFTSGLDFLTLRTPFSGGSGVLVQTPALFNAVKGWLYLSAVVTLLIGTVLVYELGTSLIPIGCLGVVIVLTYTRQLNKLPWLCAIAPGVGFGVLMSVGGYLTQNAPASMLIWLVSFVSLFPINNLLIVNQLPDIEADRQGGRRHLAIAYGDDMAITVYSVFLLLAIILLISLVVSAMLPVVSLLTLMPLLLGVVALTKLIELKKNIRRSPKTMAMVVACANLTPLVLSLTLWFK
ncbi:prenyltransferase [Pseudoalteromonas xiamenensis]|uniref:prenyltransferase n=1 Tax=Pseudoalteromonas xiamenensis TaxID=882626 RepID=UPI0035E93B10